MSILRQVIKTLLSCGLPPHRWLVRGPHSRLSDRPTLSFTFDDGPHPEHTPRILDELARWKLSATFFVVGSEVERHPGLVQRIVAEGHGLGNHTFTHSEPSLTSVKKFLDEVRRTNDLLVQLTGQPCPWVRPPKGALTWPKLRGLWEEGYTPVLWNVDPRDYRMKSAMEADRWGMKYRPRHGNIMLLHDNRPVAAELLAAWGTTGLFDQWRSVPISAWIENELTGRSIADWFISRLLTARSSPRITTRRVEGVSSLFCRSGDPSRTR